MAESRINPYQGPSGREGNTPPAWSIANFARYFRPSMFETQPPGAIAAPAVAPAGGASTFRPGGQFGFEGNGTINRDENFNLNAPGGGAAAGEEGQATGTGPITADTGARAQTQEAFQAMANPFGFVANTLGVPSGGKLGSTLGNAAINLFSNLTPVTAALNMGRNLAVNLGRFGDMVANLAFGQPGTGSNPGMAFGGAGTPASQVSGGELGMSFDAPATNYAGRTGAPSETGATGQSSTGVPFGGPGRSPDLTSPEAQAQNLPGFRPTDLRPNAPEATAPTTAPPDITSDPSAPGTPTGPPGTAAGGQASGGELGISMDAPTATAPSDTGTGTSGDTSGDGTGGGTGAATAARGGMVQGPTRPVDAVPARLTGGEFVLNPYATAVFRPALEIFNRAITAEGINPRIMAMLGIGRGEDPNDPRTGYQDGGYVDPWVRASQSARVDPGYMTRVRSGAVSPWQDFSGFVRDMNPYNRPMGRVAPAPSPRGGRAAEPASRAAGDR